MAKKSAWHVRLGPLEWPRHTYARLEDDSLKLIGSVRRGPQLGALGMTGEGQYVQVVGDHISVLNSFQIAKAVANAKAVEQLEAPRSVQRAVAAPTPVVTIKKWRSFIPG
ncbi:MAG: hypothetical protein Q7K57_32195 [Burkholderiaceae bacterium]|nr:hypothetical protein [Burkholderiaceae bacterium]